MCDFACSNKISDWEYFQTTKTEKSLGPVETETQNFFFRPSQVYYTYKKHFFFCQRQVYQTKSLETRK